MQIKALVIIGVLPLVLMQGCTAKSFDTWAREVGLRKQPTEISPHECNYQNLSDAGVLYIDAHTTYFDPSGFAIVYGRDGKPCKLNLRYMQ